MSNNNSKQIADDQTGISRKTLRAEGMSNEQARICSEYIERERNFENEAVKIVERQKVLDFFVSHKDCIPETVKPRLLSMPCIHWKFEHLFREQFPTCRFVGLEWTWGVIELGRPFMPLPIGWKRQGRAGIKTPYGFVPRIQIHEDDTFNIGSFTVVKSGIARWIWAYAGSFLSLKHNDCDDDAKRKNFGYNYRSNTHVWLDFTSQLCSETKQAIIGLGSFLNLQVDSVPVAITLMAARDEYRSDEDRVRIIYTLLNQRGHRYFDLKTWWSYTHHAIPMLTVCGLMLKGTVAPSPEYLMRLHAQELEISEKEADCVLDDLANET